ncbi:MAG: hypothetical protein WCI71_16655 [Bacteroidota bacterium]
MITDLSGQEGIDKAIFESPDLIIPIMDGTETEPTTIAEIIPP